LSLGFENPEVIISIFNDITREVNKEKSLGGGNLSIGDLADVEGLYRLEGQILPPNLMMMLNSCRQNH
jgi:hypothetical protein